MSFAELIVLYLSFRAKQVICDFFLQTTWMAVTKGKPLTEGGAKALALHAGIHGAFTFLLVVLFAPTLWWLGIVDAIVHGAIDKAHAVINQRKNLSDKDSRYWWSFALDQEAHNVTHLIYIAIIVAVSGGIVSG